VRGKQGQAILVSSSLWPMG